MTAEVFALVSQGSYKALTLKPPEALKPFLLHLLDVACERENSYLYALLLPNRECNTMRAFLQQSVQEMGKDFKSNLVALEKGDQYFTKAMDLGQSDFNKKLSFFLVQLTRLLNWKEKLDKLVEKRENLDNIRNQVANDSGLTIILSQKSSCHVEEVPVMLYWAVTRMPVEFPLVNVVSALLTLAGRQMSVGLIKTLFLNVPHSGQLITREIVRTTAIFNSYVQETDIEYTSSICAGAIKAATTVIMELSDIQPALAASVRSQLVTHRLLPSLQLDLTNKHVGDTVAFLCGALGDEQHFKSFFASSSDANLLLRATLLAQADPERGHNLGNWCALLRVYSVMLAVFDIPLDSQEFGAIIKLIRHICSSTETDISTSSRVHRLSLCFLLEWLAIKVRTLRDKPERDVDWNNFNFEGREDILNILGKLQDDSKSTRLSSEFLRLVINLYSGQYSLFLSWVADVLTVDLSQLTISEEDTEKVSGLIFSKVMSTDMLISQVESLPVCPGLHGEYTDSDVPVECIYRITKECLFENNPQVNVAIGEWVYKQIKESSVPVHPLLPAILSTTNERMIKTQTEKISSVKLEELMKTADTPVIVFILYLILDYNSRAIKAQAQQPIQKNMLGSSARTGTKRYESSLLNKFEVKKLVLACQENTNYSTIFPSLYSLVVNSFPYLFTVDDMIASYSLKGGIHESRPKKRKFSDIVDEKVVQKKKKGAEFVDDGGSRGSLEIDTLLGSLEVILENKRARGSYKAATEFLNSWKKLYAIHDHLLPLQTVRELLRLSAKYQETSLNVQNKKDYEYTGLTTDLLRTDPLMVLGVETRMLLPLAPLLEILFILATHYLRASNKYLFDKSNGRMKERSAEIGTLLYAQESAAIQILLEFCIDPVLLQEDKGVVEEVRRMTCSYVHQRFIEKPLLIKLLHFQMYPTELIAIMVEGVPSMHVTLDFLPEMLNAPAHLRVWRDFGMILSGHIVKKYPIHSGLAVAREVIHQCTLQPSLRQEKWALLALEQISEAFPLLLPQVMQFLESTYSAGSIQYLSHDMSENSSDPVLETVKRLICLNSNDTAIYD
eukprot:TRINITY_DN5836_c0_g1_i1.p1 TRINITY_DN5836_c0_g1~~TRINITY_DN5836_c0_g1_i1.p1  ORF type:complete len:1069 (-),score=196.11 TRINITY_DN5836_c0_g1_i1:16-3222(-)